MPALKYRVELTESERSGLRELVKGGEISARKLKRALALLNADEGLTDMEIAVALKTGLSTVGTGSHALCEGRSSERTQ